VAPPPEEIQNWLFGEFCSFLAAVFETMAGDRPEIEWEAAKGPDGETALRWRQPFAGISGAVWVTAAEPDWTVVGRHVLRAAGIEEEDAATLKSTYLETISQALTGLAQTMSQRLKREVTCTPGEEVTASAGDAAWANIHLRLGDTGANLGMGFDAELSGAFVAAQAPRPAQEAAVEAPSPAGPLPGKSKTFDLLLDVELPVSVSFGRAQVPLKDVLKLTTGSIIELNRSISEPVEVIVNNCVIARGEVVVVEGNFGVRIQHVISRQERLRTLN
jgi:flagellar motor switch protein FliN/FliY